MKTRATVFVVSLLSASLVGACAHYKEESGRKTEYNSDTGRFESGDYASIGLSSEKQKHAEPVSEKDLKKR